MTYLAKLIIASAVSLIGVALILPRRDIPSILTGFALVAVAGPMVYYYYSRWRTPKHPMQTEIEDLLKKATQDDHDKPKHE